MSNSLIGLFARHPTLANLTMILAILAGLFSFERLNAQFFPDFEVEAVSVSIPWPGSTALEADETLAGAVEPAVRDLDRVRRVVANSSEGQSTISVEFQPGTDMQQATAEVQAAVDAIAVLPDTAERPRVSRATRFDTVMRIVLSGDYPAETLRQEGRRLRDALLDAGADRVTISGAEQRELVIELDPEATRRLGLNPAEVAQIVRSIATETPGGDAGRLRERQVRLGARPEDPRALRALPLIDEAEGRRILLGDIATVREVQPDGVASLRRHGQPAVELLVERAAGEDAVSLADAVFERARTHAGTLPQGIELETYDVLSELVRDRINLLLRNGLGGLAIVLSLLFLFLGLGLAFWVAMGIATAILIAFSVMLVTGQSLNMVSLFALILALGILADDAIVVAEDATTQFKKGLPPGEAAESAAFRMLPPVFAALMTTLAAFTPLMMIEGPFGAILGAIPLVILAVAIASFAECFLVLPAHMNSTLGGRHGGGREGPLESAMERFRDGPFARAVAWALAWRWSVIASAIALLVISVSLVIGGRIGFTFFDAPEAEKFYVDFEFAAGEPQAVSLDYLAEAEAVVERLEAELAEGEGVVRFVLGMAGRGAAPGRGSNRGDHVGGLTVELVPGDERTLRTDTFVAAVEDALPRWPGLMELTVTKAIGGPPGQDVDLRLRGEDPRILKQASVELQEILLGLPALRAVSDNMPYGKQELTFLPSRQARIAGLDQEQLGGRLRAAYEGEIAYRFPAEDGEREVKVRYAPDALPEDPRRLLMVLSAEAAAPLEAMADAREREGFSRIRREGRLREVAVTADVDTAQARAGEVNAMLIQGPLPEIAQRYNLEWQLGGRAEQEEETLEDLRTGYLLALAAIYVLLAAVLGSYWRPLLIMAVIPFSLIGVILGHLISGFDLSLWSLVGVVGLSGIVVNDSLILVRTLMEEKGGGLGWIEAASTASRLRFRAVVLTTLTTCGGLLPLLLETSLQAQFLIPMALTVFSGLIAGTFMTLILVPCLVAASIDVVSLARRQPLSRS